MIEKLLEFLLAYYAVVKGRMFGPPLHLNFHPVGGRERA